MKYKKPEMLIMVISEADVLTTSIPTLENGVIGGLDDNLGLENFEKQEP